MAETNMLTGHIHKVGKWYHTTIYKPRKGMTTGHLISEIYLDSREEAIEWLRAVADAVYRQLRDEEPMPETIYLPERHNDSV